ncbi:NAD-dependent epimerase/dehydratase family protein, partial [Nocardia farcinica]|uniref:NAD-dependent epimerase/dehydratase family protein n=1 Tax=Nocardia farcinica TaxID=37329 RepID=UPI0024577F8A
MKVAVTGAAGYLGTNLLPLLTARGDEVIAVDRVRPPPAARARCRGGGARDAPAPRDP